MKAVKLAYILALVPVPFVSSCKDAGADAAEATIQAQPGSIDFGKVPVDASKQFSVVLTNESTDSGITVSRISFSTDSSEDFSYEPELADSSGMEIPPGQTTVIDVKYSPSSAGNDRATLVVSNSSTNEPELEIDLTGEAFECRRDDLPDDGFMIDRDIVWGLADRGQDMPSVAFDGTNYLAVWQDKRGGRFTDIYGARVDREGTVLDPGCIRISSGVDSEQDPTIAFDGTNYLVVWDQINRGDVDTGFDIIGTRVSPEGVVLDPEYLTISDAPEDQLIESISFDGTNYLVVWLDDRDYQCDIYGARVDGDGMVLDPAGIPISAGTDYGKFPSLAFGEENFLVAWQDERHSTPCIYGARVDGSGTVLDPEGIRISQSAAFQTFSTVSFDGTNFLVIWEDEAGDHYDIYGARIDRSGVVLDVEPIAISVAPENQANPSVAFDGTDFFVTWDDSRNGLSDIYGTWIDQSGSVLFPEGVALVELEESQSAPCVVFDGNDHLVVFADNSVGWTDISGARVRKNGEVVDPSGIHLSIAVNSQYQPSVSTDGAGYLVVWSADDGRDSKDIHGALLDSNGAMIGDHSVAISNAAGDQNNPSVSSDGNTYFVAWTSVEQDRGIHGAVLDRQGSIIKPGVLLKEGRISNSPPGVVFDGTEYFMVWTSPEETGSGVFGMWVDTTGEAVDRLVVVISSGEGDSYRASVAFDGTDYLVVWTWQLNPFVPRFVVGRRVSGTGEILDSDFLRITDTWPSSQPAVAFGGGYYLVVWQYPDGDDIHGVRVATNGEVLDEEGYLGISTAPGEQSNPAAGFNGEKYLVTWEDGRDRADDLYGTVKIHGSWVDPDPDGEFTGSFLISSGEGDAKDPAVSANLCGYSLVVSSSFTTLDAYNSIRIFGEFH